MSSAPVSPHDDGAIEFVTVARACEMFSVSVPTIYKLIRAKSIRAVKCGRATRIDMKSVREYFASLPEVV